MRLVWLKEGRTRVTISTVCDISTKYCYKLFYNLYKYLLLITLGVKTIKHENIIITYYYTIIIKMYLVLKIGILCIGT